MTLTVNYKTKPLSPEPRDVIVSATGIDGITIFTTFDEAYNALVANGGNGTIWIDGQHTQSVLPTYYGTVPWVQTNQYNVKQHNIAIKGVTVAGDDKIEFTVPAPGWINVPPWTQFNYYPGNVNIFDGPCYLENIHLKVSFQNAISISNSGGTYIHRLFQLTDALWEIGDNVTLEKYDKNTYQQEDNIFFIDTDSTSPSLDKTIRTGKNFKVVRSSFYNQPVYGTMMFFVSAGSTLTLETYGMSSLFANSNGTFTNLSTGVFSGSGLAYIKEYKPRHDPIVTPHSSLQSVTNVADFREFEPRDVIVTSSGSNDNVVVFNNFKLAYDTLVARGGHGTIWINGHANVNFSTLATSFNMSGYNITIRGVPRTANDGFPTSYANELTFSTTDGIAPVLSSVFVENDLPYLENIGIRWHTTYYASGSYSIFKTSYGNIRYWNLGKNVSFGGTLGASGSASYYTILDDWSGTSDLRIYSDGNLRLGTSGYTVVKKPLVGDTITIYGENVEFDSTLSIDANSCTIYDYAVNAPTNQATGVTSYRFGSKDVVLKSGSVNNITTFSTLASAATALIARGGNGTIWVDGDHTHTTSASGPLALSANKIAIKGLNKSGDSLTFQRANLAGTIYNDAIDAPIYLDNIEVINQMYSSVWDGGGNIFSSQSGTFVWKIGSNVKLTQSDTLNTDCYCLVGETLSIEFDKNLTLKTRTSQISRAFAYAPIEASVAINITGNGLLFEGHSTMNAIECTSGSVVINEYAPDNTIDASRITTDASPENVTINYKIQQKIEATTNPLDVRVTALENDAATLQSVVLVPDSTVKTSNFNAVAQKIHFVDKNTNTSPNSGITATLPASPSLGDMIRFVDYGGAFSSFNLTLDRNTKKIDGANSNKTISVDGAWVDIIYVGTVRGWITKVY